MSSPAIGAGISPLGMAAYGVGTPAVAPTPGGKVQRDGTGKQLGSLAISVDPATKGQYVFDEFGRRKGMSDASHMVILALTEIKGTCILRNLGQKFSDTRKIYENFAEEQTQRVQDALASLVSRGIITIDSIVVNAADGHPSFTHVQLTDLTTQTPIDIKLPNG